MNEAFATIIQRWHKRIEPILTLHHLTTALLSVAFFVCKGWTPLCELIMSKNTECGLDMVSA